jgi:hypothetical protein
MVDSSDNDFPHRIAPKKEIPGISDLPLRPVLTINGRGNRDMESEISPRVGNLGTMWAPPVMFIGL